MVTFFDSATCVLRASTVDTMENSGKTVYDIQSLFHLLNLTRTERAFLDAAMLPGSVKWKREAAVVAASEGNYRAVEYVCQEIKTRCPLRKKKRDSRWESMLVKVAQAAVDPLCVFVAMREQYVYRKKYKNRFDRFTLIDDKAIELAAVAAADNDYYKLKLLLDCVYSPSPRRLQTDVTITDAAFKSGAHKCLIFAIDKGVGCGPATLQFLHEVNQIVRNLFPELLEYL